jgi:hypothetical protein
MWSALERFMLTALMLVLLVGGVRAQQANDLLPFLQAEVNEIALLTAQANYLQGQGDALGAALIASYIPDHQAQSDRLAVLIRQRGGDPATVRATVPAVPGTRLAILDQVSREHARVAESYRALMSSTTDLAVREAATLGYNGAVRHGASITVAQGASGGTTLSQTEAIAAALTLERAAVNELATQAARLRDLGDLRAANEMESRIPAHTQQAACLEYHLFYRGGNPSASVPPPTLPLDSREQILHAQRTMSTQLANTYAVSIAVLPVESPVRALFGQGQQVALNSYTTLFTLVAA